MAHILIVGADQGIGYYLAERLLETGNFVTVLDLQTDAVASLKANLTLVLKCIKM